MDACDFTRICRRGTTEYIVAYAEERARRGIATTPIFKRPKVWIVPIEQERVLGNGYIEQKWYPWQACPNCIAVPAKAWCSIWRAAVMQQ
jgi:hypothetical protein